MNQKSNRMTTLCSVGVSCTTVTGHDINFDAGKKKRKKSQGHLLDCSVCIPAHWVKNLFEEASKVSPDFPWYVVATQIHDE